MLILSRSACLFCEYVDLGETLNCAIEIAKACLLSITHTCTSRKPP